MLYYVLFESTAIKEKCFSIAIVILISDQSIWVWLENQSQVSQNHLYKSPRGQVAETLYHVMVQKYMIRVSCNNWKLFNCFSYNFLFRNCSLLEHKIWIDRQCQRSQNYCICTYVSTGVGVQTKVKAYVWASCFRGWKD